MNLPTTRAGVVCRDAVLAAITPGFSSPSVDLAGAFAFAAAHGIRGPAAADLIAAASEGVSLGIADRRARDKAAEAEAAAPDDDMQGVPA